LSNGSLQSSPDTFRKSFSGGTAEDSASASGPTPGTSGVNPVTSTGNDRTPQQRFTTVGPDGNILDIIGQAEGAGYNTVFNGVSTTPRQYFGKDLVNLTIDEVIEWQEFAIGEGSASVAAGKYQIINKTLVRLVDELGAASRTDKFNQITQDKLCRKLLQIRGIDDYLAGSKSEQAFCRSLAQEWASLPVT